MSDENNPTHGFREHWLEEGRAAGNARGLALGHAAGHAQGYEEGHADGVRETILKLLECRFGEVPARLRDQIESVDAEQFDRVLRSAALAESLSEISLDA